MSPESAGLAYVEHARAITRSMADPEPGVEMDEGYARLLVRLLGRLGHFDDKLYVDLTYARDLRERAYLICRNVLGEEDVDTLMAMNDLAVLLYVRGEQPAAREFL